ncbi:MAG: LON peptidase substrate-binding domain-containing protein [Ilumatobacteraceae bacterium]
MAVLAMFPLGSVLVPGGVLSLHVFEPRYRALVQHCLAAEEPDFGVVLIDRGSEVGGGDVRRTVGTVARMAQVGQTDDGRYALIAVGIGRVRVNAWLPDDPFPLADVDQWPDDDLLPDPELLATTIQRARRAAALATELGDPAGDPSSELSDDPLFASYQLIDLAPVGAADAYDLLCAGGAAARVAALAALLDDIEAAQAFRLQAP